MDGLLSIANAMETETCALCGLAVKIEGFSINTAQELQKFCCAGCLSIYQLINDDIETPLTT